MTQPATNTSPTWSGSFTATNRLRHPIPLTFPLLRTMSSTLTKPPASSSLSRRGYGSQPIGSNSSQMGIAPGFLRTTMPRLSPTSLTYLHSPTLTQTTPSSHFPAGFSSSLPVPLLISMSSAKRSRRLGTGPSQLRSNTTATSPNTSNRSSRKLCNWKRTSGHWMNSTTSVKRALLGCASRTRLVSSAHSLAHATSRASIRSITRSTISLFSLMSLPLNISLNE